MPDEPQPDPADPRPAEDHPDYPDWLCRRVGAELKRLRLAGGRSAYQLAVPGLISDQAILNNERALKNPGFVTLGRHCQVLGTSLEAVITRVG